MSFSIRVKEELSRHIDSARHCKIAEIAAIINMCGKIKIDPYGAINIKVQTENAAVARKYFTIIKKTFNISLEVVIRRNNYLKKNRVYTLYLTNSKIAKKVLMATKLIEMQNDQVVFLNRIHPLVIQSTCCKRAYIRGAFLSSGSMSDPEKTYHLEFVNLHKKHSEDLMNLINSFHMDAKIVERKKYYVVYLKEGTQIVDLLNIMGGHVALMELENLRILKEMRNNVNRIVNCETANLNKTVSAAVRQIKDIEFIETKIGLHNIQEQLEDIARLRLKYRDATLKELGALLDPPVGKSGVNHRLRKISDIAEKLRDN